MGKKFREKDKEEIQEVTVGLAVAKEISMLQ